MAIVMLWFGFVSPAGVLLYWVTSSGWQVAQQVITQRSLAAAKEAQEPAPAPPSGKAAKKALKQAEGGSTQTAPKSTPKKKK
jgi:membrane protein insertase Oxa1/YidC/SpoIIIJ